jgi:hypothetical protein
VPSGRLPTECSLPTAIFSALKYPGHVFQVQFQTYVLNGSKRIGIALNLHGKCAHKSAPYMTENNQVISLSVTRMSRRRRAAGGPATRGAPGRRRCTAGGPRTAAGRLRSAAAVPGTRGCGTAGEEFFGQKSNGNIHDGHLGLLEALAHRAAVALDGRCRPAEPVLCAPFLAAPAGEQRRRHLTTTAPAGRVTAMCTHSAVTRIALPTTVTRIASRRGRLPGRTPTRTTLDYPDLDHPNARRGYPDRSRVRWTSLFLLPSPPSRLHPVPSESPSIPAPVTRLSTCWLRCGDSSSRAAYRLHAARRAQDTARHAALAVEEAHGVYDPGRDVPQARGTPLRESPAMGNVTVATAAAREEHRPGQNTP